ncbi:MAG: DMT family transporter [Alphaproteobacteria bacterium]|nr:DMT family transporter [Alphaproteobacteria bacterium]
MVQKSPLAVAVGYMLVYTVTHAAVWACIRYLSSDIHPLVLVFFRTLFGTLAILPILIKTGFPRWSSGLYPLYILRGILNTGSVIGVFYAVSLIPLADAVAFSYAAPIFATILAVFILKEKIGKHRIFAIGAAFIGVLILVRPGFQTISIGIVAALGASVFFAATLICVKLLTRRADPTIVSLMAFIVALPITLVAALFHWQWPSGQQWIFIVLMGVFAATSHVFLAKALARADLSAIMPIDFSRIIFAAILGTTLFGDSLSGLTFLGGGIILASAVYATHREGRLARAAAQK